MQKKILILDYQLGNLFSVHQACEHNGMNAVTSHDKELIKNADGIILPGVGAFTEAMNNMERLDLIAPLKDYVSEGRPLFGICLGLQLLFTESEEFGNKKGLGFIEGTIKKFEAGKGSDGEQIKVPQIGWNKISPPADSGWENTPLFNITPGEYMYFVHSYHAVVNNQHNALTLTTYGDTKYYSGVKKDKNIFATQFHPEKSGEVGLKIYKNWATMNNLI